VSYKSLNTLSDCAKHGAVLLVTCQCGRQVWKGARDFTHPGEGIKAVRGWMPIDRLALMLKCRCGRKGMVVQIEHSPRVPAGIPMLPFLNADDRQRKRMIRIARG
jgi:hypothetical protein